MMLGGTRRSTLAQRLQAIIDHENTGHACGKATNAGPCERSQGHPGACLVSPDPTR